MRTKASTGTRWAPLESDRDIINATARGSRAAPHAGACDFPALLGMDRVRFVHAEGLAIGDEAKARGLAAAHATIERLLPATLPLGA